MTKIELLEQTAKSVLTDEILTTDELNVLLQKASTQEEINFYTQIYNYLIGLHQQEVISNEQY